jgi:hypothetical protein
VQSSTGSIQYSDVVTLNRNDSTSAISVYPNPADNRITVEVITNDFGKYRAAVLNALGQQVYVKEFNISTRKHLERLNVTNLMRGVYFVSVFGKNGMKIKSAAVVVN